MTGDCTAISICCACLGPEVFVIVACVILYSSVRLVYYVEAKHVIYDVPGTTWYVLLRTVHTYLVAGIIIAQCCTHGIVRVGGGE